MPIKTAYLANGAEGLFIENKRFKTTLVSFNLFVPADKETVAPFTLLPFILTSCSKDYPDFSKLNLCLNKLYGAVLNASAEKYGDYRLLKMSISVINDAYSPDNESLVKKACDLLLGMLFHPNVKDGAFFDCDLEREKRKAIEHIKGEYSEKRTYARNRLAEEMFKGDSFGLPKCGTVSDVEKITGKSLYEAWKKMLSEAFVRVHVIGERLPDGLFDEISEKFSEVSRNNICNCKVSVSAKEADEINYVTDRDDVTQGKLVMGFSTDMSGNDDDSLPLIISSDIFGGGPYSMLFSNVREKMSLCYYCSASTVRNKGFLMVDSGVEAQNAEKAEKEILRQLEKVKNGDFSQFEFDASLKSICDTFKTYSDSQSTLDMWYALKVNNKAPYTPDELAERILAIKKEDVVSAAKGIKLHTVYKLLPKENKQ